MKALPVVLAMLLVTSSALAGAAVQSAGSATESTQAEVEDLENATIDTDGTLSDTSRSATSTIDDEQTVHFGNATNVLAIPEESIARETLYHHRVDLGPATGFAADATDAHLATLAAIERVERSETTDDRRQQIASEVDRIEQHVDELETRQLSAIEAYEADQISPRTFVTRMSLIDAEARALEERREYLVDQAAELPEFDLDPARMTALQRELDVHTGPVRGHAAEVLQGREATTQLYVETGSSGVSMSAIVDGEHVRETYRDDQRDRSGAEIGPEEALNITATAYPTIWETRLTDEDTTSVTGSGNLYLVRIPHAQGVLVATVEGGSESVFKDVHRQPLAAAGGDTTLANTRDGLELTVNRTYAGGPLRIALADADTGDPVTANVTIAQQGQESELIGTTDDDGVLWTLSPRSEFTVTAIRGNAAVFVTVDPIEVPGLERADSPDDEFVDNQSTT